MFFSKFSFVLAILAFFMFSATALPVALEGAAPGSLMGRTYSHKAVEAVAARSETPAVEVVAREQPLSRGERFQRRTQLGRVARRSADTGLSVVNLVAARSNVNAIH